MKKAEERDVRELAAVQNLDSFRRFMVACAARTGQMLNYSNISNEVGKDANTIKRWISVLEASGVLYPIEIKQNSHVTADMTSAFQILDKIPNLTAIDRNYYVLFQWWLLKYRG